jgi:SagB-type dehydrogenase family enzyme
MEKSYGWKGLGDRRLSRRRLLMDAAGVGAGLATLSLVGCEEQGQAPVRASATVGALSPTGAPEASPAAVPATPTQEVSTPVVAEKSPIALPAPRLKGDVPLEEAVSRRRSKREFRDSPLTLEQLSQVLWAAQGITGPEGLRAAPSAGALYPLDLYLAVGRQGVEGLVEGAYHYDPQGHALERILEGDVREAVARAAVEQMFIAEAPVILIITGEYERTTWKYSDRGVRYVHMEAGHAAQNVYLQAEALGLGTVTAGAFQDEELSQTLGLPPKRRPLYVMPIGHAAA